MRRVVIAASLVLAGTLLIAGPASAQQVEIGEADVVVLDPGQEPRQLLRYAFSEGLTETMDFDIGMAMSMTVDGLELMNMDFPMSMAVTTHVAEVDADGVARVEFEISELDMSGMATSLGPTIPAGESDAVAEELAAASAMMEGFGGWTLIDPRGVVLDVGLDVPADIPVESVSQSQQMATEVQPLPDEPVGVGAVWQAAAGTAGTGMEMDLVTTTEIVAMEGNDITLKQVFETGGNPELGLFDALGMDMGESFLEMSIEGSGASELRLDHVAQTSQSEILVSMLMGMDLGDGLTEMSVDMAMDVATAVRD